MYKYYKTCINIINETLERFRLWTRESIRRRKLTKKNLHKQRERTQKYV